jgi:hypothetical protein
LEQQLTTISPAKLTQEAPAAQITALRGPVGGDRERSERL